MFLLCHSFHSLFLDPYACNHSFIYLNSLSFCVEFGVNSSLWSSHSREHPLLGLEFIPSIKYFFKISRPIFPLKEFYLVIFAYLSAHIYKYFAYLSNSSMTANCYSLMGLFKLPCFNQCVTLFVKINFLLEWVHILNEFVFRLHVLISYFIDYIFFRIRFCEFCNFDLQVYFKMFFVVFSLFVSPLSLCLLL